MQIRKTYQEVNPQLLYDEIKDFVQKQGVNKAEDKLETYSSSSDSSSFIIRGTLIFKSQDAVTKTDKECLRAHIVGSVRTETKMMLDTDDKLFPDAQLSALQSDLEFFFGSYEVKS